MFFTDPLSAKCQVLSYSEPLLAEVSKPLCQLGYKGSLIYFSSQPLDLLRS